nr:uncharacterized protein LOC128699209 [Cherax quadricarinatus]
MLIMIEAIAPAPPVLDLGKSYIKDAFAWYQQTAPLWWVNMNALTVLFIAAAAAGSSGQLLGYSGLFGAYRNVFGVYPGVYGAYPSVYAAHPSVYAAHHGFLPTASKITLKTVSPAPLTYNVAPFAPVAPVQSQYHAQDELGQYSFGYSGGPSSRAETRDAFGIVRGSYNYVDSDGKIQTQSYVADANGFRVAGTNLPVALDESPEPVQDTAEVAEAKAAFKKAYDEAATAAAAAPDSRKKRSVPVASTFGTYSPLSFYYRFSTPLTYSHPVVVGSPLTYRSSLPSLTTYGAAPAITAYTGTHTLGYAAAAPAVAALRKGVLLRVENNPGHAVSYRVDCSSSLWFNMNALTVYITGVLAVCCGAQLIGYPGAAPFLGYGNFPFGLSAAPAPVPYTASPYNPLVYNPGQYAPVQSQYHAQDELGQYSFGFAGGPSNRAETRDAFGNVRGSYNYVDSEGKVQTVSYVADALGFRVAGTNLPVAPASPEATLPGPVPEPVQDTPEVAAAKAAFQAAYDEAAAAAAAAPETRKKRSVVAAPALGAYPSLGFYPWSFGIAPTAYSAAVAAPASVPAPAFREASLLRIENNPGHAVSYRVD